MWSFPSDFTDAVKKFDRDPSVYDRVAMILLMLWLPLRSIFQTPFSLTFATVSKSSNPATK